MKKRISPVKQGKKKDEGILLTSTSKISTQIFTNNIPENEPINQNSEPEIIFKGEIKLDNLLLINDELRKEILGGNQNFIDLFFLNKKFLYVYQVESKIHPSDLGSSYTTKGFETTEEKLILVRTIKSNTDDNIKIMQVENSQHNNYVLKRCWASFDIGSMTLKDFGVYITTFLIKKYTEYAISKLYNACPYSAKPAGFHLVHLTNSATNKMMLVSEMLSVFAGNPLSTVFPDNNSANILEYFIQILHAGNFLEAYKIEHNDIKPDNFLIEFLDQLVLIKLIDFDIGNNQPQGITTNKNSGYRGHTPCFVAPEILEIVNSGSDSKTKRQRLSELNPWKSHSYSIGILMLQMIGFIPKMMQLDEFDPLKKTESDHDQILSKLDKYYNQESDLILRNIIQMINLCLLYSPEQRASVKEILTMIENIEKKDYNYLEAEWKGIYNKREPSRTALKNQLEVLKNQIIPLQNQNKNLWYERNTLIRSLTEQLPEANISISDNLTVKTMEILNRMNNSFGIQRNRQENEILQLRNALEKSEKEKNEMLNQKAFLENTLSVRTNEFEEYKKKSALEDTQIQTLNQNVQKNENFVKIQENENKMIKNENKKLKRDLKDLQLKINQYEMKEKILKDELDQFKNQLLKKNQINEQINKDYHILKENFNSEIADLQANNAKINQINKEIIQEKEVITKFLDEEKQHNASSQATLAKFEDFKLILLKIIREKGYEIWSENLLFEEILEILKKYLLDKKAEKVYCPICSKDHDYEDMKNCIISSEKLNKEVFKRINFSDQIFLFSKSDFKFNEMILLKPLIMISNNLEFLDFGQNSEFNSKCMEQLIDAIKFSKTLKGIILFENNNDIQFNHYLTILEISKMKKNIICLYLDKKIIKKEKAKDICTKYEMEIQKWGTKNDYDYKYFLINIVNVYCFI